MADSLPAEVSRREDVAPNEEHFSPHSAGGDYTKVIAAVHQLRAHPYGIGANAPENQPELRRKESTQARPNVA